MGGIRVTYSALTTFGINLISIFTGLVFTLIVTRKLSPEEFGTWSLISGIVIYATIINPTINYWVTREIARGERSAKTAILSSGTFSVAGVLIYLVVAYFVGVQSNADVNILLFATILIPLMFLNDNLNAINTGQKPHTTSYGFLAFEIVKIPAALVFIYFLKFGVEGAILSSFIAYIASIIVLGFYAKDQLRSRFQKEYLTKWIKLFWLPTYRNIPSLLSLSDTVIFSVITGSVVGVAYYSAARTFGFLINHTRAFSKGLYPKLLETGKQEFLQENLIKLFYFAFPLVAFSIVFAKPGLFALNPIYQDAALFVIFISIRSFLTTLNLQFYQAIQGMEDVDTKEKSTFRDFAKSKLVWFPTFQLVRHGVYIGTLALLLYIFSSQTDSVLDLVFYWVVIALLVEIPLTLYILRVVKKIFTLKIDKTSAIKYLLSSIVIFGLISVAMEENLEYKNSIFEFLPSLFFYAIVSVGGYFAVTYLIDLRTKLLFKAIWNELMRKEVK